MRYHVAREFANDLRPTYSQYDIYRTTEYCVLSIAKSNRVAYLLSIGVPEILNLYVSTQNQYQIRPPVSLYPEGIATDLHGSH